MDQGDQNSIYKKGEKIYIQGNNDSKSLHNVSVLSEHEQKRLLKQAQAGDIKARNTLMESNMPFVIKVAKQFLYSREAIGELISEGCLGLCRAIDKFDMHKKNNFISYAVFWIKYYINKFIHASAIIKKPMNKIRDMREIYKVQNKMQNDRQFVVCSEQKKYQYISQVLNIPQKNLYNIMMSNQEVISLDSYISGNTDADSTLVTIGDTIPDDNVVNPETNILDKEMKYYLRTYLDLLPKRDSDILKYRYGMIAGNAVSLDELSKKYNVSKERIRQIEQRALQKLRDMFKKSDMAYAV